MVVVLGDGRERLSLLVKLVEGRQLLRVAGQLLARRGQQLLAVLNALVVLVVWTARVIDGNVALDRCEGQRRVFLPRRLVQLVGAVAAPAELFNVSVVLLEEVRRGGHRPESTHQLVRRPGLEELLDLGGLARDATQPPEAA